MGLLVGHNDVSEHVFLFNPFKVGPEQDPKRYRAVLCSEADVKFDILSENEVITRGIRISRVATLSNRTNLTSDDPDGSLILAFQG